jgi:hypothetical protein
MSWLEQIGDVLNRYSGSQSSQPPTGVADDFAKVAAHAPPSAVAGGLANAFRSPSTPPFNEMVAQLFERSDPQQRAGILNQLIAAAGPAASGVIGKLLRDFSGSAPQAQTPVGGQPTVTPQQAQQIQPATVGELAEHAQKNDPSIVDRAGEFYAQHPKLVQGLGAAALALVMSHVSQRQA